jgi:hypothetical protein
MARFARMGGMGVLDISVNHAPRCRSVASFDSSDDVDDGSRPWERHARDESPFTPLWFRDSRLAVWNHPLPVTELRHGSLNDGCS